MERATTMTLREKWPADGTYAAGDYWEVPDERKEPRFPAIILACPGCRALIAMNNKCSVHTMDSFNPLTIKPSIVHVGVGCHYIITNGRVQWC